MTMLSTSVSAATPTQQQMEQFKNLPQAQQDALAKQYGFSRGAFEQPTAPVKFEQSVLPRQEEQAANSLEQPFKPEQQELEPFGYDLFSGQPSTFVPSENTAVPDFYLMGPGDTVEVTFVGKQSNHYQLTINRDGYLMIPELTPVSVTGMQFVELKSFIKQKVKTEMIGVDAYIAMGEIRSNRIFVLGEAFMPGAYTLSSLSSISHALYISGGIKPSGSLRNIQLKRRGKLIATLDLYQFLLQGDTSNDVILKEGDVVFIPTIKKQISIDGEVNRPAKYELLDDESLKVAINYAGGLLAHANENNILIQGYEQNGKYAKTSSMEDNSQLSHGDSIIVTKQSELLNNTVLIVGAVNAPGRFQWQNGNKLSNYINKHNKQLTFISDMQYGLVIRKAQLGSDITVLDFNPFDVMNNKADLALKDNDAIVIFSRFETKEDELHQIESYAVSQKDFDLNEKIKAWEEFELENFNHYVDIKLNQNEENKEELDDKEKLKAALKEKEKEKEDKASLFSRQRLLKPILWQLEQQLNSSGLLDIVSINGSVKYPGDYPLTQNAKVSNLIQASGGLTEAANLSSGELNRMYLNEEVVTKTKPFNVNAALNNTVENITLKSRDQISIFATPNWNKETVITLKGEVLLPGKYTVKKNETLESIIKRAGGFTNEADIDAAIFTRASLKQLEKQQLLDITQQLKREMLVKNVSSSVVTAGQSLSDINQLITELNNTKPIGRLVLDVDAVMTGKQSLTLEDNDQLLIPKRDELVSIVGEVFLTSSHLYNESFSIEKYLKLAGGTKQRADIEHIYIIRTNGSVEIPQQSSWFAVSSEHTTINPGDTIVVPIDSEFTDNLTLWSQSTQILYQLAVAAAAVSSL